MGFISQVLGELQMYDKEFQYFNTEINTVLCIKVWVKGNFCLLQNNSKSTTNEGIHLV